jgi:hypothetical protein
MWRALINVITGDGTIGQRHLGSFVKDLDAALAYDQAARENHGHESKLNFPGLPPSQPQGPSCEAPTKRARGERVRPCEGQEQGRLTTSVVTPLSAGCATCGQSGGGGGDVSGGGAAKRSRLGEEGDR